MRKISSIERLATHLYLGLAAVLALLATLTVFFTVTMLTIWTLEWIAQLST